MSDVIKRENGLYVTVSNVQMEYTDGCLCHLCKGSKNLSPLKICPALAKMWAISAEHKMIVTVSECSGFKAA